MNRLIAPMTVISNVPLFGHRPMVRCLRFGIDALTALLSSLEIKACDRLEAAGDGCRVRMIGDVHIRRSELNRCKQSGAGRRFAVPLT